MVPLGSRVILNCQVLFILSPNLIIIAHLKDSVSLNLKNELLGGGQWSVNGYVWLDAVE